MKKIKLKEKWMQSLLPDGFPYPTSTLISGSGGTGKPLVELSFVSSWLKSGGSILGIPLQYPSAEFITVAMDKLYNLQLNKYSKRAAFIQFDPHIDNYKRLENNIFKANLLKPEVWNSITKMAESAVEKSDLGLLVFGSALNLLFFSPTYREAIIKKLEDILRNDKSRTYIFSVSTNVFADKIKLLEEAADNLMYTRMEKPFRLSLEISRMREVRFLREETEVPMAKETLIEIKNIAEATRKRIIPEVAKI